MSKPKMIICVDFDGTIVDHAYPDIGSDNPGALEWMKRWQDAGAAIILWTMRSGVELQQAVDYLLKEGVEPYGVNENPDQSSWSSSPKAYGHIYVDDAAFGCPLHQRAYFNRPAVDWSIVGPVILHKLREGGKK